MIKSRFIIEFWWKWLQLEPGFDVNIFLRSFGGQIICSGNVWMRGSQAAKPALIMEGYRFKIDVPVDSSDIDDRFDALSLFSFWYLRFDRKGQGVVTDVPMDYRLFTTRLMVPPFELERIVDADDAWLSWYFQVPKPAIGNAREFLKDEDQFWTSRNSSSSSI